MHDSAPDFSKMHERMQQLQAKSQAGVLTTLESGEMKKLVSALARRSAQVWCYPARKHCACIACIDIKRAAEIVLSSNSRSFRSSRAQTPSALSEAPLRRVLTTSTKRKIIMRDLVHCLESDHLLAKSTFVTKIKLLLGIK